LLLNFCDAFIGNASGPAHYMLTRNKPCLYINWFPFEMALKNEKCIIMPKLIKKKNKILSFENFNKLGLRIKYEGTARLNSFGYKLLDNKEEDLQVAIDNFVSSLNKKNWKNYGVRYLIKNKNFNFFGIRENLKSNILKLRKEVFFEPTFVNRHKGFIKK
jgi:putative glycosyltransferase (TIGR04372 family)